MINLLRLHIPFQGPINKGCAALFRIGTITLVLGVQLAATAQTISTETFFRFNEFDGIKIAPDGRHLAMSMPREDQSLLVIVDIVSDEVKAQFSTPNRQQVGDFFWANEERIIFSPTISIGGFDTPFLTGEIYALNIDNTRKFRIAGPAPGDLNSYQVSHTLPDDREHIRVVSQEVRRRSVSRSRPSSVLVDIYSQTYNITKRVQANQRFAVRSPLPWGGLYSDWSGEVRLALSINENREVEVRYRENSDSDWRDISNAFPETQYDDSGEFLGFSRDNQSIYFLWTAATGTTGLYQYRLETGAMELLYSHETFDLSSADVVFSSDRAEVIGVKLIGDLPEQYYFSDHPEVALQQSLDAAFPQERVRITSTTVAGDRAVVFVSGSQRPGNYYLMDVAGPTLTEIGEVNAGLPREEMAEVSPFIIKNREGMLLHGLVTLPKIESDSLPMIVIPHGGPIGVRDVYSFNREAQFFAHHGYAVLHINFRGSGGFGDEFARAGYQQWGAGMIKDISLAVSWAVQNNIADKDRICIMGGSYGAFASLASVVQEPQKYQCAIGYAGVYNLTELSKSDIPFNPGGTKYLDDAVGDDEEELRRQSPLFHTDKIEVPVFLAHGGEDRRAPVSQFEDLLEALEDNNKEVETLFLRNEGHGFYQLENRTEFYEKALQFVNRHLN